jgi:hypothetical protein
VAVHQQTDDDRRRDDRATASIAEYRAKDDREERCTDDDGEQRDEDLLRVRLAEVLRPQEQDRISGEEQGMERGEAARRRGGTSRGDGCQWVLQLALGRGRANDSRRGRMASFGR